MLLKCEAKQCTHNDNKGNCYAKVVNIRGERARITDQTLCSSFADERIDSVAEFAEEFNAARQKATTRSIKCGAHRCEYNNNSRCYADSIKVNHDTASCETFVIL